MLSRGAWQLRLLLAISIVLVAVDSIAGSFGLGVPRGLDIYLIVSGLYFALDPQGRVERHRQEVFSYVFFPGAFIAAVFPIYALIMISLRLVGL